MTTESEIQAQPLLTDSGLPNSTPNGPSLKRTTLTKILPTDRLSVDRHMACLRAYAAVFEGNGGKPLSNAEAGELVQPAKLAETTIMMTNAFFCDVGLLIRHDGSKFAVSSDALAFFQAGYGISPEKAPEKLRPAFERQWFTNLLTPRLRLGPQDDETVVKAIGESCGAGIEHKPRIKVLLDFLVYVGILRADGGRYHLANCQEINSPSETPGKPSSNGSKSDEEESVEGLERYMLTLEPKSKRRIVIHSPPSVTSAELKRIQQWLSFQLLITDAAEE